MKFWAVFRGISPVQNKRDGTMLSLVILDKAQA